MASQKDKEKERVADPLKQQPGYFKEPLGPPKTRAGRAAGVKNKTAAPVQITAEQLLREALQHKELAFKPPRRKITDPEELADYRLRRRKEFEDNIRRQRMNMGVWVRYATWEASQKDFDRARSIYERALDVDYRNQSLWLKYAEMEMKNKFINYARNVWDRAVTLLPRVDQFWYKYAYMEEMLGNVPGARQIFERWMQWQPDHNAWNSYIKLELRHKNVEQARALYERYLICQNEVKTYIRYARFEETQGRPDLSRAVLERAMNELGEDANDPELLLYFAQFEQRVKEYDRARTIYKYALDHVPKHKAEELYKTYTSFEKQFGHREGVEDVILGKRRFQYEDQIKENPFNYDVWFDYIRLEESGGEKEKIRQVYERAIANVPPLTEKHYWKRYIYLWINFACYEELEANDIERTEQIYSKCLEIIPHHLFTFSKMWIMYAEFQIRRKNLEKARRILGTSIGKCPREKVFKRYIELELQLGNIDRCRKLYEKYLEFMPENCYAWSKYAEMEGSLSESERARAIFELAINQPMLDMPELLWKAYIDFEIKQQDWDRVRALYTRLLQRTQHVKVWISRAQFEASIKDFDKAREVFEEADKHFKQREEAKEERVLLLEAFRDFERVYGSEESQAKIQARMPRRVQKRRQLKAEDGSEGGWEEYYDYIFPDQEAKQGNLKILEMARKWKKQQQEPAKP